MARQFVVGQQVWDIDMPLSDLRVTETFMNGTIVARSDDGRTRVHGAADGFRSTKPTRREIAEWLDALG